MLGRSRHLCGATWGYVTPPHGGITESDRPRIKTFGDAAVAVTFGGTTCSNACVRHGKTNQVSP
jgi:hypothetical protein